MRKQIKGRKLSRKRDQRKALLRNLAGQLITKEKIKTTEAKAREVSVFVEKQITKAKKNDLATRRNLARFFTPKTVKKMVEEIGPRYQERNGGCLRIIKIAQRKQDGAQMAFIEFVK
jgi:large subunit ribosomal protein L17